MAVKRISGLDAVRLPPNLSMLLLNPRQPSLYKFRSRLNSPAEALVTYTAVDGEAVLARIRTVTHTQLQLCHGNTHTHISCALQNMKEQMKKDIKVLMDVSRAADGPGAAAMEGLVRFEGAFLSPATQEATIVLEYMNGGSLEDVKRRVRSQQSHALNSMT